jgi:hypothetical protein
MRLYDGLRQYRGRAELCIRHQIAAEVRFKAVGKLGTRPDSRARNPGSGESVGFRPKPAGHCSGRC